jgi:hypothetical protein
MFENDRAKFHHRIIMVISKGRICQSLLVYFSKWLKQLEKEEAVEVLVVAEESVVAEDLVVVTEVTRVSSLFPLFTEIVHSILIYC